MVRFGLGMLIAAGASAAVALVACGDTLKSRRPPNDTIPDGGNGGAPANGKVAIGECTAACCPAAAECYANGKTGPGAECLATIDNDPTKRIQLRQTWIRPITPPGNTSPPVYNTLYTESMLPWPACRASSGAKSGYIQVIDMDFTKGEVRTGFAQWVDPSGLQDSIANGLCMLEADYKPSPDTWALPQSAMSDSSNYPPGLPKPIGRADGTWHVAPVKAKMLAHDFDLSKDRESLLAQLASTGDGGLQGYTGVAYYDPSTGYSHGYSPLTYIVIYASQKDAYIVVPIREAETQGYANDPQHPDCVGAYHGDLLAAPNCEPGNYSGPSSIGKDTFAWGCVTPRDGSDAGPRACSGGEGPYTTKGYFLITELEQVYSGVLGQTLCYSYPGAAATPQQRFGTVKGGCRVDQNWNPSVPDQSGLPQGDWCAATNSPAKGNCHDAWRSISYHTFSAFRVKDQTCNSF
jgi:hypothetical protein